jgi:hypothetical protein
MSVSVSVPCDLLMELILVHALQRVKQASLYLPFSALMKSVCFHALQHVNEAFFCAL